LFDVIKLANDMIADFSAKAPFLSLKCISETTALMIDFETGLSVFSNKLQASCAYCKAFAKFSLFISKRARLEKIGAFSFSSK
jgi:hypothetical protein